MLVLSIRILYTINIVNNNLITIDGEPIEVIKKYIESQGEKH